MINLLRILWPCHFSPMIFDYSRWMYASGCCTCDRVYEWVCVCVQWDNVALGGGFNEYGLLIGAKIYAVHIHTRSRFLSHVRINRIIDEKNKQIENFVARFFLLYRNTCNEFSFRLMIFVGHTRRTLFMLHMYHIHSANQVTRVVWIFFYYFFFLSSTKKSWQAKHFIYNRM